MNFRVFFPLAAAGLALLAVAGCNAALETTVAKTGSVTLKLEPAAKKASTSIRYGEQINVVLPAAHTGYVWQIISNDERILRQTDALKAGLANTWSVSFLALKPGKSIVRFVCVQTSTSEEVEPIDRYDVTVKVTE